MGEPRYNGAFVPLDDEAAEAAVVMNSVAGGFGSLFPKLRPGARAAGAAAEEEAGERLDFNEAGRHNGAYQLGLDPRTERRFDKMVGMHPVTKWIARRMEDPVATEKRLAAHFAWQEQATAKERWAKEQPVLGKDVGFWKALRPLFDLQAGAPVGSNTYKMHVLNMESHEAS